MSKLLVIIPLYNKELTVTRCLQSVISQDYDNFQLLIINDGSTDNSLVIAQNFKDKRITIISQENKGVSATRNTGLDYAIKHQFDYAALLDADDYWKENHLSTIMDLFENYPQSQVAATNYQIRKNKNTVIHTKFSNLETDYSGILEDFFTHNYLNSTLTSSSFALQLSVIKKTGNYKETFTHGEDTEFFIRLGIHSCISFSSQVTAIIDKSISNNSKSISLENRNQIDLDIYNDYEIPGLKKYLDLNRFSLAIVYRMKGYISQALRYQEGIDMENLNKKQQSLLQMSGFKLNALAKTKKILEFIGIDLRTG